MCNSKTLLYFFIYIAFSCSSTNNLKSKLTVSTIDTVDLWHFKDSINGLSLEKWYNENTKKTKKEIIVAILDTQIDLEHENFKNQIWVNKDEIPNNKIDDDNNGYIDDINGWNFVGKPNGGYFAYGNFEYVRIIQKWDSIFKNKKESEITKSQLKDFNQYSVAKTYLDYYLDYYKNYKKNLQFKIEMFPLSKDTLKHYFPNEDYTTNQLDSLFKKYNKSDKDFYDRRKDKDKDFSSLILYMLSNYQLNNKKLEIIEDLKNQMDSIINQNLNVEFLDRNFINDNPSKLEKGYGNNFLNSFKKIQDHNTEVSSLIAPNNKIKKGVKGFHKNIKIMPLITSVSGDEHDKDIAMAIYYAVDNGAKVINMSFGKEFSLEEEWVSEAIKYAEKHNVLIVHCSGNNRKSIDEYLFYPNDVKYGEVNEFSSNFITVGSISKRIDSTMVSPFSNYGKNNVDLFAPGEEIYVAIPDNQYTYDSGTSLAAPMVSGTAALIWLYYPNLTVQEVKKIILESGVTIDKMVIKPGTENELVHFSELCKSGKILNTYNAMKIAEEMSRKKTH
ncbi:conserved hypothetical protein [Flavobacterium sp. 9AF]|uniref:S8 family peptidase n=1 Tax=Flavobacterium sp. 9AF TaxID=2653142 RepID=UPI0012EF5F15|nr:S8 family peptidase [Flavobacterium sp. 9AF]VXB14487.1 conserved hypothetical protein [Flavobacterium sp. 9AF]